MGRTCEACGVKMPFGVKRQKNAQGQQVCEGCRAGRPGRPRTQGSVRPGIALVEGQRIHATVGPIVGKPWVGGAFSIPSSINLYGGLTFTAAEDPLADAPDDEGAPPEEGAPPPAGGPPASPAAAPAPPPSGQAPDRTSDAVVRVCPFCGSGDVVGNADGSIECGHDGIIFTIEVQPRHIGQPLVNPDGSPFEPTFEEGDSYPGIGIANAEQVQDPLADTTVPLPGDDPRGAAPAPGQDPRAAGPDPAGLNAAQGAPAPGEDPRR